MNEYVNEWGRKKKKWSTDRSAFFGSFENLGMSIVNILVEM